MSAIHPTAVTAKRISAHVSRSSSGHWRHAAGAGGVFAARAIARSGSSGGAGGSGAGDGRSVLVGGAVLAIAATDELVLLRVRGT